MLSKSNSSQNSKIGVFDSGFGGLSVYREIKKLLPDYDYIYLGDNARAPYGTRSFETIYQYTLEAVKYLFEQNCSLVILACNTASARALRTIQQKDLVNLSPKGRVKRVLGIIRPMAEEIGYYSKTKHLGVLATPGTVESGSYEIEVSKFFPEMQVFSEACPLWVPLIENQQAETTAGLQILTQNIESLLMKSPLIDTILLGCTHYPLIQSVLEKIVADKKIEVKFVAQGAVVAQKTHLYLQNHPEMNATLSQNGTTQFLSTDNSQDFDRTASSFLGFAIQSKQVKISV